MAWYAPWRRRQREALVADAQIIQGPTAEYDQVVNATSQPNDIRRNLYRVYDEWQRECWDFYDSLGEFRQSVKWKANLISRVRLRAAKMVSDQDEPLIVDEGPAHDLVRQLSGGIGGQARLMSTFTVHLTVPGECYLIGETLPSGKDVWYIRSLEEVRPAATNVEAGFKVNEGRGRWRLLPANSLVVRVWRPHERWHNVADAAAKAARPKMRELELINRHIQSQYMSRLASAGVLMLPDEVTFPTRPEFADEPDPFVAEWIEVAAEAIKTPGTASAVIPIPIKVPGEYVDKVKHIDFTLRLDDKIVDKRDSCLAGLAIELDMPPEALLGTRDVNHWNAWLIDEQGVKVHIAPDVEVICDSLTQGYLVPRMQAMLEAGEIEQADIDDMVVWYDASELILRPDRSQSALDVYDRLELSGVALRRETGFDESDAPNDSELRTLILLQAARQPVNTFAAMDDLGMKTGQLTPPTAPRPPAEQPPDQQAPEDNKGTPDQQPPTDRAGPARGQEAETVVASVSPDPRELVEQLMRQAKLMHAVMISFDGTWQLLHPHDCVEHLFSCPLTHATWYEAKRALPGTSGLYACWLGTGGQPMISNKIPNGYAEKMIASTVFQGNGHRRELVDE
jgi:hypothetical protein